MSSLNSSEEKMKFEVLNTAPEFEVVLLSGGGGSRMYPLTEEIPKVMLPVANRPLISYQLELLEKVGFTKVFIITTPEIGTHLQKYFTEFYKGKIKATFEFIKEHCGTAEALLNMKDKIKRNFMVISGDLIVQDGFIHHMADIHRTRDAALTMLLKKETPLTQEELKSKKTETQTGDIVGLSDDGKVVYYSGMADLDEEMVVRKQLLRSFPNVTIHSKLLDAHFYIFSRWVLDLLDKYKEILSIKGELIPFLVELQQKKKVKKGAIPESVQNPSGLIAKLSSTPKSESDQLGCFAYIMKEGICFRVNTLQSFMDANRELAKGEHGYVPNEKPGRQNFIDEAAVIDPKTQVGPECVVGAKTIIGERCSVKKSNIGKNCKIGHNVKIVNSVLMDGITIADKSIIQNSIICNNVIIDADSDIKDCQVGVGYHFLEGSDFKK